MDPQDLILDFARRMEFDEPQQDLREGCELAFEDGLAVRCRVTGRQEVLVSAVVAASLPGGDDALKRLLALNLGRASRQREVLAADRATGEIVLFAKVRTDAMDHDGFDAVMERFLNALDFWKTNTGGERAGSGPVSPFSMVRP
ncbi:MAG: type III secretion system chaperone [Desulfovibrionaceae bacterium]|nr:type III secretion system chaperone [Desulfovibrionaceae bacterium]